MRNFFKTPLGLLTLLTVASLVLTACGGAATATEPVQTEEPAATTFGNGNSGSTWTLICRNGNLIPANPKSWKSTDMFPGPDGECDTDDDFGTGVQPKDNGNGQTFVTVYKLAGTVCLTGELPDNAEAVKQGESEGWSTDPAVCEGATESKTVHGDENGNVQVFVAVFKLQGTTCLTKELPDTAEAVKKGNSEGWNTDPAVCDGATDWREVGNDHDAATVTPGPTATLAPSVTPAPAFSIPDWAVNGDRVCMKNNGGQIHDYNVNDSIQNKFNSGFRFVNWYVGCSDVTPTPSAVVDTDPSATPEPGATLDSSTPTSAPAQPTAIPQPSGPAPKCNGNTMIDPSDPQYDAPGHANDPSAEWKNGDWTCN